MQNWDGTGGNGAALAHYHETGDRYPLVVKLGTITPSGADVFSYAADENDMVTDAKLVRPRPSAPCCGREVADQGCRAGAPLAGSGRFAQARHDDRCQAGLARPSACVFKVQAFEDYPDHKQGLGAQRCLACSGTSSAGSQVPGCCTPAAF